ncbi:alpha/beta fold hydrolase [Hymenobacter terrenus]|uniref:alpha/beta fold hydrolase n=1 Tax=Hymenobacter terrenus TaxID=1629124 RepID=UPI0006194BCD|nr:alpha/beta hydrolase [Hymenobacter terrenus]
MQYKTVKIDNLDIFYREAGDPTRPTILLLHGFPTSSHMFRDLMSDLESRYHLVAPDYPGFGNSSFPPADQFEYSFESLYNVVLKFIDTVGLSRFSIYIQDYGAPLGLKLASRHPDRIEAIISQSGNAYMEGFTPFWEPLFAYATNPSPETEPGVRAYLTPEANQWQWTHGTRQPERIAPDGHTLATANMDRPGNREVQLQLFHDYRLNLDSYPIFQEYFRTRKPPTLLVWGKNDEIFGPAGAEAFKKDLPDAELHLLDTGHFALEEDHAHIAGLIDAFLAKNVQQ